MKRTTTLLLAVGMCALFASFAAADNSTPRVDQREARQHERIHTGVANGQLTPREANHLRAGQTHVRRIERRAKANGSVSPRERRHLNRAQNHQSHRIYRLKHNARVR